jgi:hypothetical protein
VTHSSVERAFAQWHIRWQSEEAQQEDDAMAGGNFDDPLWINAGKILPTGPLLEFSNKEGMQLYFWVIQFQDERNGAFMAAMGQPQAKDPTKWETKTVSVVQNGSFLPGQVLASAVITLPSGVISWWSTTILLLA